MAALDIGVECLATNLADGIRLVGAAGGRGTGGMALSAEFGDEVARSDLSSYLVLLFVNTACIIGHHANELHTPPCSRGPVGFTEG